MDIILQRAEKLFEIAKSRILDKNDESVETAEALRYGFLVQRKGAKFYQNFKHGRLDLDEHAIETFFRRFGTILPGPTLEGLLPQEKAIIKHHNEMVRQLGNQQCTMP